MTLFSRIASDSALISWSRAFRHGLGAGLSLPRVFRQQGNKGPMELRGIANQFADQLEKGEALEDLLAKHPDRFPPIFRDLVIVGEKTGQLPEMFGELEEFYSIQRSLRKQFYSQITWPVLQFGLAILVVALLIWILGMIADSKGGEAMAPIGFGLTGASGAITFLITIAISLAILFFGYRFLMSNFKRQAVLASMLLYIPGLGSCVQSIVLCRFCLTFRLTLETGMSVHEAIRLTLRASANAGYSQYEKPMVAAVKSGKEISVALGMCPLFPSEFLEIVHVGEESGRLPETMQRQTEYYREESARKLKLLTQGAGWLIWAMVAAFIIFMIFSIATRIMSATGL